jgi:hypothetical protein
MPKTSVTPISNFFEKDITKSIRPGYHSHRHKVIPPWRRFVNRQPSSHPTHPTLPTTIPLPKDVFPTNLMYANNNKKFLSYLDHDKILAFKLKTFSRGSKKLKMDIELKYLSIKYLYKKPLKRKTLLKKKTVCHWAGLFLKPNSFISNLATTILQHGENNP